MFLYLLRAYKFVHADSLQVSYSDATYFDTGIDPEIYNLPTNNSGITTVQSNLTTSELPQNNYCEIPMSSEHESEKDNLELTKRVVKATSPKIPL